jgi:hypothetical protein
MTYSLKEMVEEKDFREGGSFVVGETYSSGNILLTMESVHAELEVDILRRKIFRVRWMTRRGSSWSMGHNV